MAGKKKKAVKAEVKSEIKKSNNFDYVKTFFDAFNERISELNDTKKSYQDKADSVESMVDTLESIRSDMADMFEEQGCEDAHELADSSCKSMDW